MTEIDVQKREGFDLYCRVRDSGVPKRHQNSPVDFTTTHNHPWGKTYRKIADGVSAGGMFALLGTAGSGKTQMGVELIWQTCRTLIVHPNYVGNNFHTARYAIADEMLGELRDAATARGRRLTDAEASGKFTNVHLLVVDEIDKWAPTAWGKAKLLRILDHRYRSVKPTLLLGNCTPPALVKMLGMPLIDRIAEGGAILEATWPSFRRREAQP